GLATKIDFPRSTANTFVGDHRLVLVLETPACFLSFDEAVDRRVQRGRNTAACGFPRNGSAQKVHLGRRLVAHIRKHGRRMIRHRANFVHRSEEHTSELQSPCNLVCRLLLEKKKKNKYHTINYRSTLLH